MKIASGYFINFKDMSKGFKHYYTNQTPNIMDARNIRFFEKDKVSWRRPISKLDWTFELEKAKIQGSKGPTAVEPG